jgi:glycosyltransferase involved in cell wall biosynthesis
MHMKLISLVVPMYNEEPVVDLFFSSLLPILKTLNTYRFEIVVVNDGSQDKTLDKLKAKQQEIPELVIVNLSRNFGHEPAVAAGISTASGEAIIPMDADLQDPPQLIAQLLEQFEKGYDVVNARRKSRHEDSFLKRFTATAFYDFIRKLSGKINIPHNVGHFRLISRRVADEVKRLSERNRVFRIQVPFLGFKTTEVLFDRPKRVAGETHYNLKSMMKLALDSITSTTSTPLMWPMRISIMLDVLTGLSIVSQIAVYFLFDLDNATHLIWLVSNIFATILAVMFYILAIMAIYISRIFIETQNRPFFIIDSIQRPS